MKMIARLFSTKARRVLHCTTEWFNFEDCPPCFAHWCSLDYKLFGLFWITIEEYFIIFELNE